MIPPKELDQINETPTLLEVQTAEAVPSCNEPEVGTMLLVVKRDCNPGLLVQSRLSIKL